MSLTVRALKTSLLLPLAWMLASPAAAQTAASYPERQVEIIVPYAAGGGTDAMARVFAVEAARITGKNWVTVNRDGGGGVVGFTNLAAAKPDGYTLAFSPSSPMTNAPFLNPNMPFKNDQIQPICLVFENVFAISVRNESPFKNLRDLVAASKSDAKGLSYGHAGVGSAGHLGAAALGKSAGANFVEAAYRGDAPLISDMLGGTIDFGAAAVSSLAGKSGFRILAVMSDSRHPSLPDVPSTKELGYAAAAPGLNGLWAPAGTPKDVVKKIDALCKQVTALPAFAQRATGFMQVPRYMDSDEFPPRVAGVYKFNSELIPTLKINK